MTRRRRRSSGAGRRGPYPPGTGRDTFDWRTANRTQLLQKTGILNAYYPAVRTAPVVSATLAVNSFRVVFNTYFGASLPLLPDRPAPRVGSATVHVRRHHRSVDGGGAAGGDAE